MPIISINDLIFTKRTADHVDDVYNILVTCGTWMKEKYGLIHWYPPYAIEVMQNHASTYEVYSVEIPTTLLQQCNQEKQQRKNNSSVVPNETALTNSTLTVSSSLSPISSLSSLSISTSTSNKEDTNLLPVHRPLGSSEPNPSDSTSIPLSTLTYVDNGSNNNISVPSLSTNTLVGTFTIGTETWVPYFRLDMWTDPSSSTKALYLGKLAVLPEYHGYGIAKLILQKIDQFAKDKQCSYIRFDAIVRMPVLEPLYTSCGYQIVSRTAAPDASGTINELFLFEKKIS